MRPGFWRVLRKLAVPPRPAEPPAPPPRCPVDGCATPLSNPKHTFCGHHYQMCPDPLARALLRAQYAHGRDSEAYSAARRVALAAINRLLLPPPPGPHQS